MQFKNGAGKGLDGWEAEALKAMPANAASELGRIFAAMEAERTWSFDLLRVLIVFLAKPAGGERPIALMPMLMRLWDRTRRGVLQQWCKEKAQHWGRGHTGLQRPAECTVDQHVG